MVTQVVAEALVHRVICTLGTSTPEDKYSALTVEVIQFILRTINCQLKVISHFHQGSLRIERQIQAVNKMVKKHLAGKGKI